MCRLHTWYLGNWNYVGGQDWVDPNSDAALAFETNFNLDLNGDGTIGSVYSTVHTAGSVTFQKHWVWSYAVSIGGGNPIKITNGGKQIGGIYGGWEALAAAEVNGVGAFFGRTSCQPSAHLVSR